MTEEEIIDCIDQQVEKWLDNYYSKISDLKEDIDFSVKKVNEVWERVNNFENQLKSHSVGVMNVYAQVQKINDKISLEGLEGKINALGDLKANMKMNQEYIDQPEVQRIFKFMLNFRNDLRELFDAASEMESR